MTRVVLAMIVRDEAHSVAATIASALPFVDSWCIADTGSVDGTADIVRDACADKAGRLMCVPFVNFYQARNAVLDAIEPGTWVLWLDADDRLVNGAALRSALHNANSKRVECLAIAHHWSTGQRFGRPTIVKAGSGWRFEGRVHEVLRKPGAVESFIRDVSVFQVRTSLSEMQTRARQPWDVQVLEADLADSPGDPRATHYLQLTRAAMRRRQGASS